MKTFSINNVIGLDWTYRDAKGNEQIHKQLSKVLKVSRLTLIKHSHLSNSDT